MDAIARVETDYAHNLLIGTELRNVRLAHAYALAENNLLARLFSSAGTRDDVDDRDEAFALYRRKFGSDPRAPRRIAGHLRRNVDLLAKIAGLDTVETRILELLVMVDGSKDLGGLFAHFGPRSLPATAAILGAALHLPPRAVHRALMRSGRLVGSGLVAVSHDWSRDLTDRLKLVDTITEAIHLPELDRPTLLARILPIAEPSTLTPADFMHAGPSAALARHILGAAVKARATGVNILVHGETGTGKTELARLLADEVGAKLFVAGLADGAGESPTPRERLASLSLGHRLVPAGSSILLFDELEDLFAWKHGLDRPTAEMSKQWFNQLLERTPIPTLWLTNRLHGIDRAFLRRFTHVVELRAPGPMQRTRVLMHHLGPRSGVSRVETMALAHRFDVSPADLGASVTTARLVGGGKRIDRPTLEHVLGARSQLLHGRPPAPLGFDPSTYDPSAANASMDLVALADRLADSPLQEPLSMCLYGAPGTGKSAFVRYLAARMGRTVVCRTASDILGSLVGQTEQAIAKAFEQAEDEGAVLLFDEVDSFLRDRRSVHHGWEVTQVNELLQRLESFCGVVACTTNLWKDLDQAAARRFVLKIEFRPMMPPQARKLFTSMLAKKPTEDALRALDRLGGLAPGDFAVAGRRLRALHGELTPELFLAALEEEAAAKPRETRRAGFA